MYRLLALLSLLGHFASHVSAEGPEFRKWVRGLEQRKVELSCVVWDLDAERTLFSHRAREALIPASNMKLLTTAALLESGGLEYELVTEVAARGTLQDGVLHGDLWFIAEGDPGLQDPVIDGDPGIVLERVGKRLRALGVREVRGALVIDGRAFDGTRVHASFPANQLHLPYAAPVTALSLAGACAQVHIRHPAGAGPRGVFVEPDASGLQLVDRVKPGVKPAWYPLVRGGTLTLRGTLPTARKVAPQRCAVDDPEEIYATVLATRLARAGIRITSGVRHPRADEPPARNVLLRFGTRATELVYHINKESLNHASGVVWKHLGWRATRLGTFESGADAVRSALVDLGVARVDLDRCTLAEGSGLGRDNRISARVLVDILRYVAEQSYATVFRTSLPLSGIDGSLENRMRAVLRGKVRAKTGWIRGASSLAGYLTTRRGRNLAFALIMNYAPRRGGLNTSLIKPAQEKLLKSLYLD